MKNETLEIVSNDFIERLDMLAIDDSDRLELMMMINNLLKVDDYEDNRIALQKAKTLRRGR